MKVKFEDLSSKLKKVQIASYRDTQDIGYEVYSEWSETALEVIEKKYPSLVIDDGGIEYDISDRTISWSGWVDKEERLITDMMPRELEPYLPLLDEYYLFFEDVSLLPPQYKVDTSSLSMSYRDHVFSKDIPTDDHDAILRWLETEYNDMPTVMIYLAECRMAITASELFFADSFDMDECYDRIVNLLVSNKEDVISAIMVDPKTYQKVRKYLIQAYNEMTAMMHAAHDEYIESELKGEVFDVKINDRGDQVSF